MKKRSENEVAKEIVDAAYHVHVELGPGLLESVYEFALMHELSERGLRVESQVPLSLVYRGVEIQVACRADLIVEDLVLVELKSVEKLLPVHFKQVLTYLRLSGKRLGLLINFNVPLIKDGIKRVVNRLQE